MQKPTKIVLSIGLATIILIIGWFALSNYAFNHPSIKITFLSTGEGEENVYTVPRIEMSKRASEEWDNRFHEASTLIDQMIQFAGAHMDDTPYHYDTKVENIDGRTTFTFYGYYTKDGEKVEVSQEYALDYILTDDIEKH